MDFALTDDHLALRDAVRRFCDGEVPAPQRGNVEGAATSAQRHAGLAALGLLGLPFDEELGGSGQGPVEAMLAAQELGRALAGSPWLASSVIAGPLLAEAGTPAQCMQWLPAVARGEAQLALACHETTARHELCNVVTRAQPVGPGWRLQGRKSMVLGGDSATLLLVVARSVGAPTDRDGLSLFAVEAGTPGLRVQPFRLLDGRGAAHLQLDDVLLPADRLVGPPGAALPLIEAAAARANAALCAESAGALEALLALTCEHLKTRQQFGAPLAKFQALQHEVADMAIALEQLKSMACVAAMALEADDTAERDRLVSAAKVLAAQLGRRCGLAAIQLHGAMGMTDECRAGHYAKRLITNGLLFGDAAFHLQRVAAG
jgi:alkylation response protein AidB-like acyl-CoA dehydrogenase